MDWSGITVLVAEDQAELRMVIRTFLHQLGVRKIMEAADGEEALLKLKRFTLNARGRDLEIMLVDWNMPRVDGLQLLRAVRAERRFKNTSIIMVTAESDRQSVMMAMKQGANDYLVKPFQQEELQRKIAAALERRHPQP